MWSNGIVAVGKNIETKTHLWARDFPKHTLIAAYFSEIYVKKNLYIDLVNTPSELHKFSTNVNIHFSKENDFEAKQILYVRWQIFIPFSKDAVSMHRKFNSITVRTYTKESVFREYSRPVLKFYQGNRFYRICGSVFFGLAFLCGIIRNPVYALILLKFISIGQILKGKFVL